MKKFVLITILSAFTIACVSSHKSKHIFFLTLPEIGTTIKLIGNIHNQEISTQYRHKLEYGIITLHTSIATAVHSVKKTEDVSYFVIPFVKSNQGTGVFWYVGLFQQDNTTPYIYTHTDSKFLGDRIGRLRITYKNNTIYISFDDYAFGQSYSEKPTEEKIIKTRVLDNKFY